MKNRTNNSTPPLSRRDVINAGMDMIATGGWNKFTIDGLARTLETSPATLGTFCRDTTGFLCLIAQEVDEEMASYTSTEGTVRDRLFDLIMYRLDLLEPWRHGISSTMKSISPTDVRTPLTLSRNMFHSMEKILNKADVETSLLRTSVLELLFLRVLHIWSADTSPDKARTMRALDENLAQIEKLAETFSPFCRAPFMRQR